MDILVTGFKPFLGESINPSEKLANELGSVTNVRSMILTVEFGKSFEVLKTELAKKKPDYLILIGQAGGRKNVCFEKIGLNWVQTNHADENGMTPVPGMIHAASPLALMSKFPIDEIYKKLKKQGLPVEISFSAGAFVCNDLYFRVLNEFTEIKTVFIHVPMLPEQLKTLDTRPALAYAEQALVLKSMIELL
ncbi:MAG: pyroglutamyl-peptidase I [Bdellovibrio sp.]|nr:pyroglutamyl-peptidase I [Bdellovibrio sp.]